MYMEMCCPATSSQSSTEAVKWTQEFSGVTTSSSRKMWTLPSGCRACSYCHVLSTRCCLLKASPEMPFRHRPPYIARSITRTWERKGWSERASLPFATLAFYFHKNSSSDCADFSKFPSWRIHGISEGNKNRGKKKNIKIPATWTFPFSV